MLRLQQLLLNDKEQLKHFLSRVTHSEVLN